MRKRPVLRGKRGPELFEIPAPDLTRFERSLAEEGRRLIAGVDEAGRGCLAGPVVAAAVILPEGIKLEGINDSKKLSKSQREHFFDVVCECAVAYSVASIDSLEIDRINILEAALLAMRNAVNSLKTGPDFLLIDGPYAIDHHLPQRPIIRGDGLSQSVAAASILAKVSRDKMMCGYEEKFPDFKFSVHKGYGTKLHMDEIKKFGPTPIHRLTFAGVKMR